MTRTDLKILDKVLRGMPMMRVILHSPCKEQIDCFKSHFIESFISVVYKDDWDINNKSDLKTDLLFLGNVLMYIDNPKHVIENIRKNCKFLLIQDLIYRNRSNDATEFGDDGDCMRYSFRKDCARIDNSFDLSYLDPIHYESYMDEDSDSKHFIILI